MRFKVCGIVLLAMIAPAVCGSNAAQSQIRFTISVDGGLYPVITGTTDMPDGTVLFVNIMKPWLPDGAQRVARGLPACGDDCFPATTGGNGLTGANATVRNGSFVAGPFSFVGRPFQPGTYDLEITLSADTKSATPEQIRLIGTHLYASTIQVEANGNAAAVYEARFLLAGYLLRSAMACRADVERIIALGTDLISTPELKTMSKAFPDTTRRWMEEGTANFNAQAMNQGVGAACANALTVRNKAEAVAKQDR
jgi:hypothetical protein